MKDWKLQLNHDPIKPLLSSSDLAITQFVKKYLLDEDINIEELCKLREPRGLLRKQNADGSWKYQHPPKNNINYNQYQTYLNLSILVEKYGLNNSHEAVKNAGDYLLSFQTDEGDIRGIYGKQYTPNYTAAITEILIKSGYSSDSRIRKSLNWLYSMRQNDGGWALPFRTRAHNLDAIYRGMETLHVDKTKPSSHLVTGMVLRAFALDSEYRIDLEIQQAGALLSERLFLEDYYPDRKSRNFWYQFTFPFIYPDLLSALDSLSLMKLSPVNEKIALALNWFRDNQSHDGGWNLKITRGKDKNLTDRWLSLAIARVFKRFYG